MSMSATAISPSRGSRFEATNHGRRSFDPYPRVPGLTSPRASLAEEGAAFLDRDFNQCFAHLRHYNTLSLELLKFTFTFYTAIIGVSVGLYQFSKKEGVDLTPVATAVLACSLLIGVLLFLVIVRNRGEFRHCSTVHQ